MKDIEEQPDVLVAGLGKATFEERRSLVRFLLPSDQGCLVKLHKDGGIEIEGILPMATDAVEMKLTASVMSR